MFLGSDSGLFQKKQYNPAAQDWTQGPGSDAGIQDYLPQSHSVHSSIVGICCLFLFLPHAMARRSVWMYEMISKNSRKEVYVLCVIKHYNSKA
jgi:hypothetical protein